MTTPDQSKGDRSRDEVLAGEYVLGVLGVEDRLQVEERLRTDRTFATIVRRWEDNLSQFNDDYGLELPPEALFAKIEGRLFSEPPKSAWTSAFAALWNSLALWRGLAVASVAVSAVVAGTEAGLWDKSAAAPRWLLNWPARTASSVWSRVMTADRAGSR